MRASGVPGADLNVTLMDLRTCNLAAGQLNALNEVMSLGSRWELIKSPAETRRRHYIRSVLFGYATLGDPNHQGQLMNVNDVDDVQKKKRDTMGRSEIQLHQLLTSMFQLRVQTENNRTFVGFDTSLEKENAVWALNKIQEAVTRVELALRSARPGSPQQTLFTTWFGASYKNTISLNYHKILSGINKGICLIKDTNPQKKDTFAYVYTDGPNDPPRLYLCAMFWEASRVTWGPVGSTTRRKDGRLANDNGLGIILHELSHLFVGTQDHEYGENECMALARNTPVLAGMNADSYEYYAESVMTAHF